MRVAVTMIPAKIHCPLTQTLEYSGYLMSANAGHYHTMYECVDGRTVSSGFLRYNHTKTIILTS